MRKRIMTLSTVALITVSSLGLVGCQTVDPYTGETKTSNTAKGAGIGALGGAVVGAMAGDTEGAIKGAILGAGAGAGIGYYMDRQEAKLREQLAGTGVSVTRDGDNILLNMPGNITFDTDSSQLNSSMQETLSAVALVLQEFDETRITVDGHTDSTGTDNYNLRLSQQRAEAVANYLTSLQLAGERFSVNGLGPNRPIADNSSDAGRALNRRVEITLQPLKL